MKATVTWVEGLEFVGHPPSGHPVRMDAAERVGGRDKAARPLELVLLGLGGCAAMDVISILGKARQRVTSIEVALEGTQREDHPRSLEQVKLTCRVVGENLDEQVVRRAMELSERRYCSVAATLRSPVAVNWELEIIQA